jgi:hypothetical protein
MYSDYCHSSLAFSTCYWYLQGEVCNAGMSGEQAAIQIHTTQVHAFPVSSVNVASGEVDIPAASCKT